MKRFNAADIKLGIASTILYGLALIFIPIASYLGDMLVLGIVFTILAAIALKSVLEDFILTKIEINDSGIKFLRPRKNVSLTWEEIKIIGISDGGAGRTPCIYFSTNVDVVPWLTNRMHSKSFVIVAYQKAILKEIKKYWPHDIVISYKHKLR
jgi:hypothetical protein